MEYCTKLRIRLLFLKVKVLQIPSQWRKWIRKIRSKNLSKFKVKNAKTEVNYIPKSFNMYNFLLHEGDNSKGGNSHRARNGESTTLFI